MATKPTTSQPATEAAAPATTEAAAATTTAAAQPDTAADASTAVPAAADSRALYTVLSVPIRHDGELYAVGSTVPLTARQADLLGGLVMPAGA
jgi:hypothetical protein